MTASPDLPPGYWAARIALLSLRAALPKRATLGADRYLLAPSPLVLTADAAARRLAELPKPLLCMAEPRDHLVYVTTAPSSTKEPKPPARRIDFLGSLVKQRYGEPIDDLTVIWMGRGGEQLRVKLRDVAQFYGDYDCSPSWGAAADWIDSDWAKGRGVTPTAAQGAVAALQVFAADSDGWWFSFRLPRWLARFVIPRLMRRLNPPSAPRDA